VAAARRKSSPSLAGGHSSQHEFALAPVQLPPGARFERFQFVAPDSHPDEAQRWMADARRHPARLAILALDQLQPNPAGRHGLPETDWRDARGRLWLRVQQPGLAREGSTTLDQHSLGQEAEAFGGGDALDLRPIFALMSGSRMEQALVQGAFVAQQKQTF